MYRKVKAWVEEDQGRLLYLGGNGIDCAINHDHDSSAVYLTETPETPDDIAYKSRFSRIVEPQEKLLGVAFSARGLHTAAPYAVTTPDHWIFEGTGLAKGDEFGHSTLHARVPGGASGHETDKVSANSPLDTVVLAKGKNPDEGGADMVCRELKGGGAVFSVGSITYCASLLVDDYTSRITRNVFDKFLRR